MLASLALSFLACCGLEQAGGPPAWQQAELLARSGQTHEALQRFQHLVSERPDDVEARIWVGRLLYRLGNFDGAEREFRTALRQNPAHVDALVGLAAALTNRGAHAQASEFVRQAERLAPQSAEVLAARGRLLGVEGRSAEAEAYYARASAMSPDDRDIMAAFDRARRHNRHRLEASFQQETSSPAGPARVADIAVDVRASNRVRVHARVQAHERFSRGEARVGGGVDWRPAPFVSVHLATMAGPGADVVPRTDTRVGIQYERGRLELGLELRRLSFASAAAWIEAPGVTVWLTEGTALTARYYRSQTSLAGRSAASDDSGLARVRQRVRGRLWLDLGYSRGHESLHSLSLTHLTALHAESWSAGVLWHAGGPHSLSTAVDYQRRQDGQTLVRLTAAVIHRF